ncbi:MAG: FCSD flavin-binding domain-containing protein [Rhodoblastus sp.]
MTHSIDRRAFMQCGGAVLTLGGVIAAPHVARAAGRKVVVVGGGPAGATAAKYLKLGDPSLEVTLIEANPEYYTCFMSNEVIGGDRDLDTLKIGYEGLAKRGVKVVHDFVTGLDAGARTVSTKGGQKFAYDRCVVAPGIDFNFGALAGYSEADIEKAPHAWKAGPQTALLRKQLEAMPDGGNFVIVAPPNPFRCPPGPYERASLVANYFKKHKPKSKIISLDPKDGFSKQGLFQQAWTKFYGFGSPDGMIQWISGGKGGKPQKVDMSTMTVETEFDKYKADVLNVIPAQKAGRIAFDAGLVEGAWAPVDKSTMESKKAPGVHVLGDASDAATMPKSGYAANSQAKVAAAAIIALLKGEAAPEPSYINTCYSVAAPDYAFSVAGVYRYDRQKNSIAETPGAGGLSRMDASAEDRKRELQYAHSWFRNIRADSWG